MDIPTFFKAALENKLPVIEKYLSDKGDPNVCDEVQSSFLLQSVTEKRLLQSKVTLPLGFIASTLTRRKRKGEGKVNKHWKFCISRFIAIKRPLEPFKILLTQKNL